MVRARVRVRVAYVHLCSVRIRARVGVGVRVRVRVRVRIGPPVRTVTLSRLAHLLHGLQLRERGDGGRADLDRAARLPAIRQPGVPVVVEVVNRVEAREAPSHAPHGTCAWAVGGGRWRWAWVAGAAPGVALRGLAARVSREALGDGREAAIAYGVRTRRRRGLLFAVGVVEAHPHAARAPAALRVGSVRWDGLVSANRGGSQPSTGVRRQVC